MLYGKDVTYHIFNRSNELIFKKRDNYIYFLRKIRKHILPYADLYSYCLMPNHFHILLAVNEKGTEIEFGKPQMQYLSKNIGAMLSSYTQAFNRQENRKGSLFAHTTKARMLNLKDNDYLLNCFMYIHQNPLLAGLVERLEDWEFSSYPDYIGKRNGSIIKHQLALEVLNIDKDDIEYITNHLIIDKTDGDFL